MKRSRLAVHGSLEAVLSYGACNESDQSAIGEIRVRPIDHRPGGVQGPKLVGQVVGALPGGIDRTLNTVLYTGCPREGVVDERVVRDDDLIDEARALV